MVGLCLKEPSSLSWNSGIFYTKKGRRKLKHVLVWFSLWRGHVSFSLPEIIHRWVWSGCILWGVCVCLLAAQLCPTPCNPMDYSLLGSSLHGILQTRILEWVAIPFSRGSFQPRDWTQVSCVADRFFTVWLTGEALTWAKQRYFSLILIFWEAGFSEMGLYV